MITMEYFKRKNWQLLVVLFFITSAIFVVFPELDLLISSQFYNGSFYMKNSLWEMILYKSVPTLLTITILGSTLLCLFNSYTGKKICAIDTRKTLFLMLVLVIGSGLIVNLGLKNHSGRARPVHITEFNGESTFTPAFVFSNECDRNCSFSSGHSSAAYFFLALAMLFKHRKLALLAAFTYGGLVSLARIAAGGHFFSDCVVSFFIMAFTADILFWLLTPMTKNFEESPQLAGI